MFAFLRKLWVNVRPYKLRLFVGLACGVLSGVSNAFLVVAVRVVVNLVFGEPGRISFADQVRQMPGFLRDAIERVYPLLPDLQTPSSKGCWRRC